MRRRESYFSEHYFKPSKRLYKGMLLKIHAVELGMNEKAMTDWGASHNLEGLCVLTARPMFLSVCSSLNWVTVCTMGFLFWKENNT